MLHVIKKILLTLLFINFAILLNSCSSSYNSLQLYDNCSNSYESMVKVQECAHNTMQNLRRNGSTIYTSDPGLQNYWDGLVYKVRTNQLSDREAWTRLRNYQVQKNAAAATEARQLGEAFDGLNCILYGVAC